MRVNKCWDCQLLLAMAFKVQNVGDTIIPNRCTLLTTALKMDSKKIKVLDIHRLPQIPLMKIGKKVNQPIIAKLDSALDKSMIFNNLKRLKSYNDLRRMDYQSTVYVIEHLPKAFLKQKELLMPYFKKARMNEQKTFWRAENGEYVLYMDNKKISTSIQTLKLDSEDDLLTTQSRFSSMSSLFTCLFNIKNFDLITDFSS